MLKKALSAGQSFPRLTVKTLSGGSVELGAPEAGYDWRMVVVYRGRHCPICTKYLKTLNTVLPDLHGLKIDVIAVSADPLAKVQDQMQLVQPDYTVGYDLQVAQMEALGLYISNPRTAKETDRPFAEPGVFVINTQGKVQVLDISNAPFARPDLETLVGGLGFIRNPENNYPIRGTYGQEE